MFYQHEHIGAPEHFVLEENCNYSFPTHIHQCFEVISISEGTMNVTVDEQVYLLKEGESILIFPNQLHSLDSTKSRHTLCIFSSDYVKAFYEKTRNKIPVNNKFRLGDTIYPLFEQLKQNDSEMFKKGALYLLCDSFDKNAEYMRGDKDNQNLLRKIFTFVDKNFATECTLSALSKEVGYNYSYLSRYFNNAVGFSFNTYVNNYRLNHACYLLKNSNVPVTQCALECGFVSLRSFNRNFKQNFGISPTNFRKK